MKCFHKLSLLVILLVAPLFAVAQSSDGIRSDVDTKKFPEVSFVYHTNNPDELGKLDFRELKEGNKKIEKFDIEHITSRKSADDQYVVVLWEDMASHSGQFKFTQDALIDILSQCQIDAKNKIYLATYNRKTTNSALNDLTPDFTHDRNKLLSAVKNYKPSKDKYKTYPQRSDFYTAVREGIEKLKECKGAKAIIVFTAGCAMESAGADVDTQVLEFARREHVPVYIVQYNVSSGENTGVQLLADGSYGRFYSVSSSKSAASIVNSLYKSIRDRYAGRDYRVIYKSKAGLGGKTVTVSLNVQGVDNKVVITSPEHTLMTWVKENLILAIAIVVGVLLVIIAIIALIVRGRRNAKKHKAQVDSLREEQNKAQQESEQRIQELKGKMDAENQKREQEAEEAEMARLASIMRTKNLSARLVGVDSGNKFKYEIAFQPVITIGRAADNNLVLTHNTVSSHHAKIVFDGRGFTIIDTNSTNKVVVNGNIVAETPLYNGDKVGLGESVFTFYC